MKMNLFTSVTKAKGNASKKAKVRLLSCKNEKDDSKPEEEIQAFS